MCLLAALLAGCSTISGLDGTRGATMAGGMPVTPGQAADFTSFLANRSGETVVLSAARLLGVPGYRMPKLVGVLIQPGNSFLGAGSGWPPSDWSAREPKLQAFRGFKLRPGQTAQLLIGVRARELGDYAIRGVSVTVSAATAFGGETRVSVPSLGYGAVCVVPTIARGATCSPIFTSQFPPPPA